MVSASASASGVGIRALPAEQSRGAENACKSEGDTAAAVEAGRMPRVGGDASRASQLRALAATQKRSGQQ